MLFGRGRNESSLDGDSGALAMGGGDGGIENSGPLVGRENGRVLGAVVRRSDLPAAVCIQSGSGDHEHRGGHGFDGAWALA